MILVDTSGLLANYDRSDRHHLEVQPIMLRPQRRILSPFVLAELDYLVSQVAGQDAELVVLEDVARGAYELATFEAGDVRTARGIIERYGSLRLGLADASIVVLAHRFRCWDVLTFDQRDFRAVLGPDDRPFRLVPLDGW